MPNLDNGFASSVRSRVALLLASAPAFGRAVLALLLEQLITMAAGTLAG
ncbi:hypothetical protein SAMN05444920_105427 [Nonomuraea solani]|uniref:Uncharacterized protein n=1 Tax=Nonomuraea solani TaxID=1144553 RepID=A0A1H6DI41_9ACTN|nr:hypothetical protein [Nonomuraea solani]SEG84874.1 hypothetical protein SAMN05444920_105427 [Nonomuraea solani]